MSSVSQLDSAHSVVSECISEQLLSSLEDGLRSELICNNCRDTFTHLKGVLNSTNISRKMGTKINFPLPNDKIWSKINVELEQIIPSIFSAHISTSDLSLKLDKWLHVFFVEQFGTLPAPKAELILIQKKNRTNRALQHLPKRKKNAKLPLSQPKLPRIILNKLIEMRIVNTLTYLFLIFTTFMISNCL
jgi:hypothetical protein